MRILLIFLAFIIFSSFCFAESKMECSNAKPDTEDKLPPVPADNPFKKLNSELKKLVIKNQKVTDAAEVKKIHTRIAEIKKRKNVLYLTLIAPYQQAINKLQAKKTKLETKGILTGEIGDKIQDIQNKVNVIFEMYRGDGIRSPNSGKPQFIMPEKERKEVQEELEKREADTE